MKLKTTITAALTTLTFAIVSCDKQSETAHSHDGHDHSAKAPVAHDHDGDGIPDHAPGEPCPGHGDHSDHDHGHDHAPKVAGPNGGKIMTAPNFKNEFYVTDDRKVKITFLDKDNKPAALDGQEVSVVCGDRSNPTNLTFAKSADGMSLMSDAKLPEGNNFPVIVTVKTSADAEPAHGKFSLNLTQCSSCDYKEYACTCDHHHH